MTEVLDVIGGVVLVVGAALALIGAIGLVRLPDLYTRMHAATKPQTLGLLLVLVGLALILRTWSAVATLLIVLGAQALTAPMAAHLLGRATHRAQTGIDSDLLVHDELASARRRAEERGPNPGRRSG
ncbi:hypothetical protein GCM10027055_04110 [Janibacter alkaliphilus]|uniref:Multicomponent Na+:H+ antiporter subunit G n=1 Tax=Janibacter alkaliphilus TaxID=1069963 RepID=A0A852X1Q3_9MICO|nr:monovalent cation/H(+) antiporter subunit G [Janibacter alkaliphilus]NYG37026.1 multicomponent Na+:H+ antiporter subunit G [Janibacter alkaliphilus]